MFESTGLLPLLLSTSMEDQEPNKNRFLSDTSRPFFNPSSRFTRDPLISSSSTLPLLCSPGLINFTRRSIGRATKRARRSRASKRADRRVGRYSIAPQGSSTAGATRSFARLRLRLRLVRPRHGRNSNSTALSISRCCS